MLRARRRKEREWDELDRVRDIASAIAWILQIVGTYFQMRHYREVLGGITRESSEGFVGVGNAKATFGKGVILILVADENGVVRRALRMRGMTVFARFKEAPDSRD